MAHPNDPNHRKLQEDVEEYARNLGYVHAKNPIYEGRADYQTVELLKGQSNPTAMTIRGRSDRALIHAKSDSSFLLELKTTKKIGCYFTIEAYPLLGHIFDAVHSNVLCLYACRDVDRKVDCGFWAHEPPRLVYLRIPPIWKNEQLKSSLINGFVDDLRLLTLDNVEEKPSENGSGDAYVTVALDVFDRLRRWTHLIDNAEDETNKLYEAAEKRANNVMSTPTRRLYSGPPSKWPLTISVLERRPAPN